MVMGVQTRECDGVSRSKCGDEHANDRTMRERIRRSRKQWNLSYSVVDLVSPSRERFMPQRPSRLVEHGGTPRPVHSAA